MSRPRLLAVLLIAVALAGTALVVFSSVRHPASSPVASRPAQGTASATRTVTSGVCTRVKGCRLVASIDVDGDGRTDQVGVVGSRLTDGGSITVRVRTATRRSLQTTGRHVFWFDHPFFGAVPMDGRPGAEIVVGSTMGANYEEFRVITYRHGKLVTLPAPPQVWTSAKRPASTPRWGIDGSYSINSGVYRQVSAHGAVTLTMKTADRNASGRGFTGHTTSYRWVAGHWTKVSAQKVGYRTDQSVRGLGGWHVSGLHAFAG